MNNIDNSFRKMMLYRRDDIKRLLLTDKQVKLLNIVKEHKCVDAAMVASELKISLPNASLQLARLWEKTYLQREDVGDPSGGSLYQYFINTGD